MREIKFKGYNGDEILDVKEIIYMDDGTTLFEMSDGSRICNCGKSNCLYPGKIMQHTGLKDENGK